MSFFFILIFVSVAFWRIQDYEKKISLIENQHCDLDQADRYETRRKDYIFT